MGGGDSYEPEEMEAKQALAEQAAVSLQRYGEHFVPLENSFIQSSLNRFGDQAYTDAMGRASTQTAGLYDQAFEDQAGAAFNQGIDPTSGRYTEESSALREAQARGMGLAAADAGITNTDQGYAGLANVVKMGQGLATDSMEGTISLAQTGLDRASQQSQRDFARSQSLNNIAGTVGGMAANYGLNNYGGTG